MKNLKIESLDKKIKLRHIAKAVYTVLGQQDRLLVELVFSDSENMRNLNHTTRGVDRVTDVLSYPSLDGIKGKVLRREEYPTQLDGTRLFLGSIMLCEDKIKEQAQEYGHSLERERTYLIVHGLMHLFGYDHMKKEDKKEMREKEKQALALLGIKDEQ